MPDAKQMLAVAVLVGSMIGQAFGQSDVAPDSVEELDVITAGAGVEFGRTQCGTVCPEPPSIRKAARAAHTIFVGKAESVTVETRPLDLGPGAIKIEETITIVDFSVTEVLKGPPGDKRIVRLYSSGMCGLDVEVGESQLVYATLSEGELWTHIGMRSGRADDAGAEIARLRRLKD